MDKTNPTDKAECLYDLTKDTPNVHNSNIFKDIDNIGDKNISKYADPKDRITRPFMTQYEKTRIIGLRTSNLKRGAKSLIKDSSHLSEKEIAILELENNLCPYIIIRPIPNSKPEKWKISELKH